jgi:D-threo-aldose 1-dehydrogenase
MIDRARRLAAVCERHGVPLRAAAVQFPLAHPVVASVVAGVRSVAHLDDYPALMQVTIPAALWAELRHEGLIRPEAPTPA